LERAVPAPFRARAAGGLLAAAAVGLSTAVLTAPGIAQATPSGWSFSSAGGTTSVTVPDGTCAIEWTVVGGRGGTAPGVPGPYPPIGTTVTTVVAPGDVFTLAPGSAGGAGTDTTGGVGGTNRARPDGAWDGAPGAPGGGGGGAASVVLEGGDVYLSSSGGSGAGGDGTTGDGGSASESGSARLVFRSEGNSASLPEGQDDGLVTGHGVACGSLYTGLTAPAITGVQPGDRQLTVWVSSLPSFSDPRIADGTGWDYRRTAAPG
jgi:hypothetical protein